MSVHRDGRAQRSERARAAVADALLELIQEGDLRPTAERIAERAGVSMRLVFHHFSDLEALFAAAASRHLAQMVANQRQVSAEGPVVARIDAFVEERANMYERASLVHRA